MNLVVIRDLTYDLCGSQDHKQVNNKYIFIILTAVRVDSLLTNIKYFTKRSTFSFSSASFSD